MSTHYETLGIRKDASAKQVKASYRSLVKLFHPDRFAAGSKAHAEAEKRIREINPHMLSCRSLSAAQATT